MIRFLLSLIVFASLGACSKKPPSVSCVDPFLEQFKCDTELPCNDDMSPQSEGGVILGLEQSFDFGN